MITKKHTEEYQSLARIIEKFIPYDGWDFTVRGESRYRTHEEFAAEINDKCLEYIRFCEEQSLGKRITISSLHEANAVALLIILNQSNLDTLIKKEGYLYGDNQPDIDNDEMLAVLMSDFHEYHELTILNKCFFQYDFGRHAGNIEGCNYITVKNIAIMSLIRLLNDTHCMGHFCKESRIRQFCKVCSNRNITLLLSMEFDDIVFCDICNDVKAERKRKAAKLDGCFNCAGSRIIQAYINLTYYLRRLDIGEICKDENKLVVFNEFMIKYISILLYKIEEIFENVD